MNEFIVKKLDDNSLSLPGLAAANGSNGHPDTNQSRALD